MAIQVVDNFLDKQDFINIKNMMLGNQFPWFYHNYVSDKKETDKFFN